MIMRSNRDNSVSGKGGVGAGRGRNTSNVDVLGSLSKTKIDVLGKLCQMCCMYVDIIALETLHSRFYVCFILFFFVLFCDQLPLMLFLFQIYRDNRCTTM